MRERHFIFGRKIMDDRGSAMITSIVVGVVMAVFCLSLLLITYSLYAQTAKRNDQIKCKYMAGEIAGELSREITDTTSDLYSGLKSQVFRKNTSTGMYEGIWSPEGVNNSQASDTIEFDLKSDRSSGVDGFDTHVSFSYVTGDEDAEDASQKADKEEEEAMYDNQYANPEDVSEDEWDEMVSSGVTTGGGASTVTISVTCSRGDEVFTAVREVEVTF